MCAFALSGTSACLKTISGISNLHTGLMSAHAPSMQLEEGMYFFLSVNMSPATDCSQHVFKHGNIFVLRVRDHGTLVQNSHVETCQRRTCTHRYGDYPQSSLSSMCWLYSSLWVKVRFCIVCSPLSLLLILASFSAHSGPSKPSVLQALGTPCTHLGTLEGFSVPCTGEASVCGISERRTDEMLLGWPASHPASAT